MNPPPFDFKQKRCAKNAVAYNIKGQIIKLDKSKFYGNLRRGILKVKTVFCALSLAQKYPPLLKYQAFWHIHFLLKTLPGRSAALLTWYFVDSF